MHKNLQELAELLNVKQLPLELSKQMILQLSGCTTQEVTEVHEFFKFDTLMDHLMSVYSEFYTEEEIDELCVFYRSPVGKKSIAVLPTISARVVQMTQDHINKILTENLTEGASELYILDPATQVCDAKFMRYVQDSLPCYSCYLV
jgi:hypothetical protein